MASVFGHTASIIGFNKLFPDNGFGKKVLFLGIISSIIPDIDVLSSSFGIIAYDSFDFLAHRGLTHSILFGVIWAMVILKLFHHKEEKHLKLMGLFYFLSIVSHGLLDSMTNGGDGISFFLPFDMNRYFFPYQFIEVSPIGVSSFFSEWGLKVLASEIKYIGIPSLLLYAIGYLANKNIYK